MNLSDKQKPQAYSSHCSTRGSFPQGQWTRLWPQKRVN